MYYIYRDYNDGYEKSFVLYLNTHSDQFGLVNYCTNGTFTAEFFNAFKVDIGKLID